MATTKSKEEIAAIYEKYAQEYLASLPLEHFMEAPAQGQQRKITLESLDLVAARRTDFHVFNELLIQYPVPNQRRPGQVVPDNMVVISDEPVELAGLSFKTPIDPGQPYWVLEYVSKSNQRKDYVDNLKRYAHDLKIPYYLTFYPDDQDLRLYRHNGRKYVLVKRNKHGRLPIPDLDIEVALLDGWVRFWYEGELLPLPADLQRDLDEAKRQTEEAKRQTEEAKRQTEEAKRQTEEAKRRADDLQRQLTEAQREIAELRGQTPPRNGRRNNGNSGPKKK